MASSGMLFMASSVFQRHERDRVGEVVPHFLDRTGSEMNKPFVFSNLTAF